MNNERVKKAYQFFDRYPGHLKTATEEIAERLGITYDEVAEGRRQYRKRNKDNDGGYDDYNKKENHDNSNQNRGYKKADGPTALKDQTLEEYCESIGIDFEKIDPYNDVKYWTDGMGNRRYSIVPKKLNDDDFDPIKAFKKEIEQYSPKDYSDVFNKSSKNKDRLGMINLFDAHIDKICSTRDTDQQAGIEQNIKDFEESFDELLSDISNKNPEEIVIPIGNDFFHTNDFTLSTKGGTPQADKVHITGHDAFRIGFNLLRKCTDKARSVAPVILIFIRGNHDEDRVRYLLECFRVAYENQSDVNVVDSHKSRQYKRYGTWLFGFAHGDKSIKLKEYPTHMTTDKDGKKHWSEIKQAIFFLGHYHHEKKYIGVRKEDFNGVTVYMLRATSGTDTWHWEEGWKGVQRTAYGFIFDADGKRDYEYKVNI